MHEIIVPMRFRHTLIRPDYVDKVRVSDDMQQTLALLCGFDGEGRRLLNIAQSGVLNVCQPRIQDIIHEQAAASPVNMTGDDIACTEVMLMGHPLNTGIVWVRADKVATVNNSWPLYAKDVTTYTIDNLKQLNFLMSVGSEKLIIAYSR